MPILMGAAAIGKVLGGIGKGRAEGRQAEANVNLNRDHLATSQYGIQQRSMLDAADGMARQNLDTAKLGLEAPQMRAKQAAMGDMLANFNYKAPTHARANVVDFGSPFNPSASSRELGRLLSSGALADQKQGNSPLQQVDYMSMLMKAPGQTPLPKASWLDKLLNTAGAVGSIGGAVGEAMGGAGGGETTAKSIADIVPVQTGVPNFGTPASISAPPWRTGRVPNVNFGGR